MSASGRGTREPLGRIKCLPASQKLPTECVVRRSSLIHTVCACVLCYSTSPHARGRRAYFGDRCPGLSSGARQVLMFGGSGVAWLTSRTKNTHVLKLPGKQSTGPRVIIYGVHVEGYCTSFHLEAGLHPFAVIPWQSLQHSLQRCRERGGGEIKRRGVPALYPDYAEIFNLTAQGG